MQARLIGERMAIVKVRMYATVRECSGTSEMDIDADSIGDLLRKLSSRFGASFSALVSSRRADEGIVILHNGRNIGATKPDVALSQGDEVCIFPPVSGG